MTAPPAGRRFTHSEPLLAHRHLVALISRSGDLMSSEVQWKLDSPGVLRVRYEDAKQMAPLRQQPLLEAIREHAKAGPVAILFEVGPAIRVVSPAVPAFWLTVTGQPENRLCAISVVSPSLAVRTAASGFGIANSLRRIPLVLRAHEDLVEATAWLRGHVGLSRAI